MSIILEDQFRNNQIPQEEEDASKILFPRYFELEEFLPESKNLLTEYLCTLCKGVYHEPYIISCGHIFCKSCIATQTDLFEVCPICLQRIEKEKIVNVQFLKTLIDKQTIYCKKRIKGCEWSGALMHLKEHMDKACEFRSIPCENAECDFSGDKNELSSHKDICPHKKFVCEYCKRSFKVLEQQKHGEECEMKVFACPNACGMEFLRSRMQKHLEAECLEALVKCEFAYAGCSHEFRRKEKPTHEKENCEKHLALLSNEFLKLKDCYERKCSEEDAHFRSKGNLKRSAESEQKIVMSELNEEPAAAANINVNEKGSKNYLNFNNHESKGKSFNYSYSNNNNYNHKKTENDSEAIRNKYTANKKNSTANERIADEKANIFNMKEIFPSNSKQSNNSIETNHLNTINNINNKALTTSNKNSKNFSALEKTEIKYAMRESRENNDKKAKTNIPTFDLESSEDEKCSNIKLKSWNTKVDFSLNSKTKNEKVEFRKNADSKIPRKANEDESYSESEQPAAAELEKNNNKKNDNKESKDFVEGLSKDVDNDCESFLSKKRLKDVHDFTERPNHLLQADEDMQADSVKKRKVNEEQINQKENLTTNKTQNQHQQVAEPVSLQLEPETEYLNPFFDMKYISEGLEVCNNKVTDKSVIKPIPYHKFAFIRLNLSEADESWKIQLDTKSNWISVGVCVKELVVKNNYKFSNSLSDPKFPHSFFGFSSNGFTWNKNVPGENNKKKEGLKLTGSQEIKVSYDAANLTLTFKTENCSFTLTKVFAEDNTQLVPCVVFSKNGDSAAYFKL